MLAPCNNCFLNVRKPIENLPEACTAKNVANASMVALLVIGTLAALALATSSSVTGWGVVGLGGVAALATLKDVYSDGFKGRKVELIVKFLAVAGAVAVGVLGGMGMITPQIVGFALIGTVALRALHSLYDSCCVKEPVAEDNKSKSKSKKKT